MEKAWILHTHTHTHTHSSIKELTPQEVDKWLWHQQDVLVRLFQRKEYSWRHEDFVAGAKKRGTRNTCMCLPISNVIIHVTGMCGTLSADKT